MGFHKRNACAPIAGLSALVLVALLAACSGSPAKAKPTATAFVHVSIQAPTTPPAPTTAPVSAPARTDFVVVVGNTGGDGAALRKAPGSDERLKPWPDGTRMTVVAYEVGTAGETWSNVRDPDGTIGWIATKYLISQVAAPSTPAPPPDARAAVDEFIAFGNAYNAKLGSQFFVDAALREEGKLLAVSVSDLWYSFPQDTKARTLNLIGSQYALIAEKHGLGSSDPNDGDYPSTALLDTYGKELAHKSRLRSEVYR